MFRFSFAGSRKSRPWHDVNVKPGRAFFPTNLPWLVTSVTRASKQRISKLGATGAIFVDLKRKTVAVEAKKGQTLDEKAAAAEIVEAGYDVVKVETVQHSVEQVKAELKERK